MQWDIKSIADAERCQSQRQHTLENTTSHRDSAKRTLKHDEIQDPMDSAVDAGDEHGVTDAEKNK